MLALLAAVSAVGGCSGAADSNGGSQPVSISEAPQETSDTGSLIDTTVNSAQTTPTPASEETTAVTTTATTTATTTTTPQTTKPAPEWTETKASGKMYLAVSCYSRKKALLGAETVKLYDINDIVTVTAITDTGYYKIKDGTFIHSDYLSKEKVVIQTTVATTTTATTTPKPVATKKPDKDNATPDKNSKYISSGYEPLDDIIFPILDSIITGKQTDTQKLKAIYDYLMKNSYAERVVLIPQSLAEYSEQLYAISLFEKGYGVCYDFTSAFKYMSRAIGFDTRMIYGRHTNPTGGSSEHTWAELDIDGTTYIFDPAIEKLIGPNGRSRFMRTYDELGQFYIFV